MLLNVRRIVAVSAVVVLSFGLVGCGDDDSAESQDISSSESTGVVELTPVDDTEVVNEKPVVTIPEGNPPTDLVI